MMISPSTGPKDNLTYLLRQSESIKINKLEVISKILSPNFQLEWLSMSRKERIMTKEVEISEEWCWLTR